MSGRFWESLKHPGSEHRKTSQPPSSNLTRFRTPTPSVPSHGSRLRSLSLSLFLSLFRPMASNLLAMASNAAHVLAFRLFGWAMHV